MNSTRSLGVVVLDCMDAWVPFGTDEKLHVPSCHYGDDNLIRSHTQPSQDFNARQDSEAG